MPETLATGLYSGLKIGWIDLTIILVYLIGIVGIGCWAGLRRRNHEGDSYFLGGRSITWPVIGTALFASNISTVHMVSLAECGYKSGLLYGNFEWMAPFTLICLALFFAPFYIRSRVTTLPDFLEKRYSRACRDWMAILSIFAAILVHIGFAFFTGATVLHGMFGVDRNLCILVAAGLAGAYTIVGGLLAVMVTEAIQTVILLIGAICITLISLHQVGGWSGLEQSVHPVNFSIIRPNSDPTGLSMWAVFLGYPVIGLWYWCCDQVIVQRVLSAKDENHARVGPLFTGFIKILPMFIFVLPGLICLGLIKQGAQGFETPLDDPKDTLTHLINNVLPVGVKGIMAAALLAAMMGSVSAALNSIATVFSYDVVKRWWPNTSEHRLVTWGRIATATAMVLSIAWSPLVGRFETIFQGLNDIICYMAPPITAVFLLGVFWRKTSSKAAIVTMLSQFVLGVAIFIIAWQEWGGWKVHSMLTGFGMFWLSVASLIALSLLYPDPETPERLAMVWRSPLEPLRGRGWRWLGNYRIIALALFLTMIGLYWRFSGAESYYPVAGVVTLGGKPLAGAAVSFEGVNYNFTEITGPDGRFAHGSKSLAGGAPKGSYRVKIDSSPKVSIPTLPAKVRSFDTSGFNIVVEPTQNHIKIDLAEEKKS